MRAVKATVSTGGLAGWGSGVGQWGGGWVGVCIERGQQRGLHARHEGRLTERDLRPGSACSAAIPASSHRAHQNRRTARRTSICVLICQVLLRTAFMLSVALINEPSVCAWPSPACRPYRGVHHPPGALYNLVWDLAAPAAARLTGVQRPGCVPAAPQRGSLCAWPLAFVPACLPAGVLALLPTLVASSCVASTAA